MATPLLGETCSHLASIMFFVEAAVLLREKQTVTQEAAYWKLPSVNKQCEYAPSFLITEGIPKKLKFRPFFCLLEHATTQCRHDFQIWFPHFTSILYAINGLPIWPPVRLQCIVVQFAKRSIASQVRQLRVTRIV